MIVGNYKIVAADKYNLTYLEKNTDKESKKYGEWVESNEYYQSTTSILNRIKQRLIQEVINQDELNKVLGDIKCLDQAIITMQLKTMEVKNNV